MAWQVIEETFCSFMTYMTAKDSLMDLNNQKKLHCEGSANDVLFMNISYTLHIAISHRGLTLKHNLNVMLAECNLK